MGQETEKMEKQNGKMRSWIERHIGKVIIATLPVLMLALASWIWTVEGKIAKIESSRKENVAQWKVLYENREQMQALEVEVKAYKLAFGILSGRGEIKVSAPRPKASDSLEEAQVRPEPKPIPKPREHKIKDFRREQIQQMAAPSMPPKGE